MEMNKEQAKKFFEEVNKIRERCCNCAHFNGGCHQDCMYKHGNAFEPKPSLLTEIKQKL